MPLKLNFLERFSKITDQIPRFYDLIIYIDYPIEKEMKINFNNTKTINFSNYQKNDVFVTVNIVKTQYSSITEIIYKFFKNNKITISKQIAQCLYAGIYENSLKNITKSTKKTFKIINKLIKLNINLSYINANLSQRETLAKYRLLPLIFNSLELHNQGKIATIYLLDKWLKQTGATYLDYKDIPNEILNIAIVDTVLFFRKVKNGIRVSLKSKRNIKQLNLSKYFKNNKNEMFANCNTAELFEAKRIIVNYIKKVS
jgi:phosphoesterase RecJ-like protein